MTDQFYRVSTTKNTTEVTSLEEAADLFRDHVKNNPNDYIEVWDIGNKQLNWSMKLWNFDPPK
jgi:hypothetical protein